MAKYQLSCSAARRCRQENKRVKTKASFVCFVFMIGGKKRDIGVAKGKKRKMGK